MSATEHRFVAYDGTPIFYRRSAVTDPAAGALILHGMGEHGGRYETLCAFLSAAGITSMAPDLRGYGLSGGARGCLRSLDDHHRDLSACLALLARQTGPRPLFIIGHSFGGLLAATWLARFPACAVAGAVLSSPVFGIAVPLPLWRHGLSLAASWIVPDFTQPTGVRAQMLTHDIGILKTYAEDPLIHYRISARLYRILSSAIRRRTDIARGIKQPLLVLQAGEDRIVSVGATVQFFHETLSMDKELEVYPGFYHEILNETGRERVFVRISRWILSHASALRDEGRARSAKA